MKSKILFPIFFCILLFSCEKDPSNSDIVDYFIFGNLSYDCDSNCNTWFKLTDSTLMKGEGDPSMPEGYTYNGTSFPRTNIALAKALLNDFPDEFFSTEKTVFGCPNCNDQGGYYAEIKKGGVVKSWRIDNDHDALPTWLKPYKQKIADTVTALQ